MKTLGIIGSGVLGLQMAHYAITDKHYDKVVFIDDFATEKEKNGYAIIGNTNEVEKLHKEGSFDELIIGIGYNHLNIRKELYKRFSNIIPFGKIIHSTCWLDSTAIIKDGCFLYPNSTIDYKSIIMENTIIANDCTIAHDVHIGSHSFFSARIAVAGFVVIEEQCFLGINSTIIDNIKIIANTQTGAGTIVIKNIEKPGLYVGNPVKFIR